MPEVARRGLLVEVKLSADETRDFATSVGAAGAAALAIPDPTLSKALAAYAGMAAAWAKVAYDRNQAVGFRWILPITTCIPFRHSP